MPLTVLTNLNSSRLQTLRGKAPVSSSTFPTRNPSTMHGLMITVATLVGVSCLLSTTGVAAERHRVRGAVKASDAVRVCFVSGFGARKRKSVVGWTFLSSVFPHLLASVLHSLTQSLFLTCCSILRYETRSPKTSRGFPSYGISTSSPTTHGRMERFVRWTPLQVPHTLVLFCRTGVPR